jgi:hypothetical protein
MLALLSFTSLYRKGKRSPADLVSFYFEHCLSDFAKRLLLFYNTTHTAKKAAESTSREGGKGGKEA